MSKKNRDNQNRWRSKTVAFRVSRGEWAQFEKIVALTGLTKQDFLIRCISKRDIVVNGNPRVAKALKDELSLVLSQLKRIDSSGDIDSELLDIIKFMSEIICGLHNEERIKKHTFRQI